MFEHGCRVRRRDKKTLANFIRVNLSEGMDLNLIAIF